MEKAILINAASKLLEEAGAADGGLILHSGNSDKAFSRLFVFLSSLHEGSDINAVRLVKKGHSSNAPAGNLAASPLVTERGVTLWAVLPQKEKLISRIADVTDIPEFEIPISFVENLNRILAEDFSGVIEAELVLIARKTAVYPISKFKTRPLGRLGGVFLYIKNPKEREL